MHKGCLFLTLRTFSATGGIEKVSRQLGKALYDLSIDNAGKLDVYSMYDNKEEIDEKYFPRSVFKGFNEYKVWFMLASFFTGIKKDKVILSHINLLLPGVLIKIFSSKTKLIMLAHGIEVWDTLPAWKRWMLGKCDKILPVSSFTKNKMITAQRIDENKLAVLNNCLDPFLSVPKNAGKDARLLKRYGLQKDDIILMTLTRLSSKEKYKGYDNVLAAMPDLKKQYACIKYLILGKYDYAEKKRLNRIISELKLEDDVIITGYIPDDEIAAHFETADIYIMPSKKEGFGLVFIEAMYYGKPVVAGNKDGSADALGNGEFGLLVDPDDTIAIKKGIEAILNNRAQYVPLMENVLDKFSFSNYKKKLGKILFDISADNV